MTGDWLARDARIVVYAAPASSPGGFQGANNGVAVQSRVACGPLGVFRFADTALDTQTTHQRERRSHTL